MPGKKRKRMKAWNGWRTSLDRVVSKEATSSDLRIVRVQVTELRGRRR
jgi:hypothetical protein